MNQSESYDSAYCATGRSNMKPSEKALKAIKKVTDNAGASFRRVSYKDGKMWFEDHNGICMTADHEPDDTKLHTFMKACEGIHRNFNEDGCPEFDWEEL